MTPKALPEGRQDGAATAAAPRCRHFGKCGGCRLQDMAYEDQLAQKKAFLEGLFRPLGWTPEIPMHPAPQAWYYRNKMEFSFQDIYPTPLPGSDYLLLGLKQKNRWDKVMDLEECYLLSPEAPGLLKSVRAWAQRQGLQPYNLHRHKGFLRHLVVREGKNTGERMVLIITTLGDFPSKSFLDAILGVYPASTVLRGIHAGKADVANAETLELLSGEGHIHEKVLDKTFRISPYSFFQTNTCGTEFLYSLLREWLTPLACKNILDLYCGSGGISLCVADLCEHVLGVEITESALADARHNAGFNKIRNAEFLAAKVEEALPELAAQRIDVDTAIVDPPRCGLHPRAASALKDLGPGRIIYVSCNPKAMAEDIRRLSGFYDLVRVLGVDLFPHTDHLEAVALLQRVY